ncbi:uncharacterized protein BT62DRAFT_910182 [Guyanagaster necrorhizus]|uniref:Uncharacterized protein n=1 Tax=Guyanagaster necrorhizus TaxID=856835 RepID=A0A9P8AMF5_9AGAR|nr:uncharacterized protein BT62DRAFT_910182 [Guyanagaster necrorhizus MCA 3950]KAG7440631.1 hypothetical protein BT62DRAFT_910182 [Guyanagaster necrorhizus MCA 3950]
MKLIFNYDFDIVYVLRVENMLSDALSCLYSNDDVDTIYIASEFLIYDEDYPFIKDNKNLTASLLVGLEANAV